MVLTVAGLFAPLAAAAQFLHELYDRLFDSPTQRRLKQIGPMPFGVVFLLWKALTVELMRGYFRLMET